MNKSLMIVTEAFVVGGVETYIRTEVEELCRQGWQVHLVCGRTFSPLLVPDCVTSVTHGLALGPDASVVEFLGAVDQMVEIARRYEVAVIHAHPFTSLISALACAQLISVPMLVTLHGPSSVVGSYGAVYDFMVGSLVLPAASGVTAVSQEVRDLAIPYVEGDRLFVWPNAVAPIKGPEREGNGRWLLVSRLDSNKITGVLDFVSKLLQTSGTAVDICGAGEALAQLEAALVDAIDDGRVRLLAPTASVQEMMLDYAGIAGMGRVALEGLVQGLPVMLVGYDGVKGMIDDQLYADAAYSNFSGRGLPTLSEEGMREQLQRAMVERSLFNVDRVVQQHNPASIWAEFAGLTQSLSSVEFPIIEEFVNHLRAAHPYSQASAYWSQEVMDSLSKIIAGGAGANPRLQASLMLFANAHSRTAVEREIMSLRENVSQLQFDIEVVSRQRDEMVGAMAHGLEEIEQSITGFVTEQDEQEKGLREVLRQQLRTTQNSVNASFQQQSQGIRDSMKELLQQQSAETRASVSGMVLQQLRETRESVDGLVLQQSRALREQVVAFEERAQQQRRHDMAEIRTAVQQHFVHSGDDFRRDLASLRGAIQMASAERAEFLKNCLVEELGALGARLGGWLGEMRGEREELRQQVISSGESMRETQLAFNKVIRGFEKKMENSLARMESEIKQELQSINGGIDRSSALDREIQQLLERIDMLDEELDSVYSSSSWVMTRPLRFLKRLVLHPKATYRLLRQEFGGDSVEQNPAGSRPGAFRRMLNLTERTVRTGRLDPSDRARLAAMVRNSYSTVAHHLGVADIVARPTLAEVDGQADVFVWSVIDWHFRMQRPQHLAAAMAGKGHRVFYISNNFVDSSTPGFAVEALDGSNRLFQINLHVKGAPQIYTDLATTEQVAAIRASLAELLAWATTKKSISLVQHPYWIESAQSLPNMQLVYDCMDHHGGFEGNASSVLAGEKLLVERSDLLIVTSQWLLEEMSSRTGSTALIRNATEYEHFCNVPERVFADSKGRQVIGYYGAIAEWFDVELIRRVAIEHPDALVLLIGRDTAGAQDRLAGVSNVEFVGEVPYSELPYWLHGFDVCLLPFQVIPLTLATNPVKVYEYLSAGKPVVSVDLPEMTQFEGLVELADNAEKFSSAVGRVLASTGPQQAQSEVRKEFAARQTWAHRAADLDEALADIAEPRVSVIVLCYNNVEFTEACLDSLHRYSDYPNLEVIAVDNASTDRTPEMLAAWEQAGPNRRYIANAANLGFSAGNNVGLKAATGDYLVILNNDTYVTPGWVRSMAQHLRRNPGVGLVGPVTNNIGNEARIEIHYASMEEMITNAGSFTRKHPGAAFAMPTAAFFCVMLTRAAYEKVGLMDEAFGVGFFEDDDYCRRLAREGFGVLCAEDVFVHHHLSASFNKLKADAKQKLFETNKAIFEAKWGEWVPHVYRERPRL